MLISSKDFNELSEYSDLDIFKAKYLFINT